MYQAIRPLLFQLEAEKAHKLALASLDYLPHSCFKQAKGQSVKAMGLEFPHAVGLAAGLDKNGEHLDGLAKLGFSFIEIGTVTPLAQIGNPQPRLFRLPEAEAIINRMGFNNKGVDALVDYVQKAKYTGVLGINIGKNKETPLNKAADDYLICLRKVYKHASYVTINISSPNTPELRQLQQGDYLDHLLGQLKEEQQKLSDQSQKRVPLVVKISPDETDETLKQMADTIVRHGIDGIIATNTTCARAGVEGLVNAEQQGGLSGQPLKNSATHCLGLVKSYVGNALTLIGVGGIDSPSTAQEKLDAGATLIQVYTGLIYKGPNLVSELVDGLYKNGIP